MEVNTNMYIVQMLTKTLLQERIASSVKKQENSIKSLDTKVTELEIGQKNYKSTSEGKVSCAIFDICC